MAKLKFDLREPDEIYFAQKEIEALLETKTEFIRTLAFLFKKKPFNLLNEEIVHLITRLVYLGEGQGFLAKIPIKNVVNIAKRVTFFREIYIILESRNPKDTLWRIGIKIAPEPLNINSPKIDPNCWTQVFLQELNNTNNKLITVRLLPFQTLFEYATEVKKLPSCVFRAKKNENWKDYFTIKEFGIEKGLNDLIKHLKEGNYRSPHFGLGKNHIGDFVDWASTDLRKPFLHYLHKYKGKGDPRISRALINLLKVKEGNTILDPFVGSGAFIADAPTMGLNAIGIEILNIGKIIAETKCNLGIDISQLKEAIIKLFEQIDKERSEKGINPKLTELREKIRKNTSDSATYKKIEPYLNQILLLKEKIETIEENKVKRFLLVLLSQQILEYSERVKLGSIIDSFKSYVEDRYMVLYATQKMAKMLGVDFTTTNVKIIKGDSTDMSMIKSESIDGILTSPPYFDALDYIGNNKISILILGLDEDLKWGSTKNFYEAKYRDKNKPAKIPLFEGDKYSSISLPESSLKLIELLKKSQRMHKAEVVQNYLKMMKLSFEECYRVLKKNKYYLMVISKYHRWIIQGKEEIVETSPILADLGKSVGFNLVDVIEHGLSKADKGKIGVEDILVFQKQ
ncbi:MAG: hypothetical protein ABIK73_00560 [candidate division WOR-3 bacterium]